MNLASSAQGLELKNEFMSVSRHEFQRFWVRFIGGLFPNIKEVSPLAEYDRSGIDALLFVNDRNEIDISFQCKGLESDFENRHEKDCLKSINSFKKSGLKVKSYILVVNRIVKGNHRINIENQLREIKTLGIAENTELLDINGMIQFITKQFTVQLKNEVKESYERFMSDHARYVDLIFYYQDVPFRHNDKLNKNPLKYLVNHGLAIDKFEDQNIDFKVKARSIFVLSEFGFGKTTLLLHLSEAFMTKGLICIYIPISQCYNDTLTTAGDLSWRILELINDRELERNLFNKFKSRVLRQLLMSDPSYVLLFDGLDEHPFLYTDSGLGVFFSTVKNLKSCLFAMRESFWYERQGNFEINAPKRGKKKETIKLLDWEKEDILNFCKLYSNARNFEDYEYERLRDFKEIIKKGKYLEYFGDIPKRPLFLEMLISDFIDGSTSKITLTQLYEKYLFKKFTRDRKGSFDSYTIQRPLTLKGDAYLVFEKINDVLSNIAGLMLEDIIEIRMRPIINESILKEAISKIKLDDILELLMNSILVASGKREYKHFSVKFSHRSFQEYYTAMYLVANNIVPKNFSNENKVLERFVKEMSSERNEIK